MLDFELDDELKSIQDTVRRFAEAEIRPRLRECEEAEGVPEDLASKYHELGLALIDVPEEAGGLGLSAVARAVVEEELAVGDIGVAFALPGPGLAAYALLALGTPEQQARLLAPFGEEKGYLLRGAVGFTETDAGWDVSRFETTAKADGDVYVLDGRKTNVLFAGAADLHIVFARLEEESGWAGIRAFAIEKETAGVESVATDERLGLATAKTGEVRFSNCRVSKENVLSAGEDTRVGYRRYLVRSRPMLAARAVGLGHAAFMHAARYATERVAFGKPIAEHQAIAFMAADMATEVNAARWMVWRAASAIDGGKPALRESMMATAQALEMAMKVADDAVQILGGHGYVKDHPVEKWMRDAKTLIAVCGTTQEQNALLLEEELGLRGEEAVG